MTDTDPARQDAGDARRDYSDPAVAGPAADEDHPQEPTAPADAGATRPGEPDPDAPTDEVWEGNTLKGAGPDA